MRGGWRGVQPLPCMGDCLCFPGQIEGNEPVDTIFSVCSPFFFLLDIQRLPICPVCVPRFSGSSLIEWHDQSGHFSARPVSCLAIFTTTTTSTTTTATTTSMPLLLLLLLPLKLQLLLLVVLQQQLLLQ